MPWARFDDRYPSHYKVRPLSDSAFRLDVSAICWSSEHLTDGVILDAQLRLVSDVKRPRTSAEELVKSGRWTRTTSGYVIHDYHVYNPTAERVKADRAEAAERQRRAREAAKSRRDTPTESQGESHSDSTSDYSRDLTRSHSERAVPPARPDPVSASTETPPPSSPHVPRDPEGESTSNNRTQQIRAVRTQAGLPTDGWTDRAITNAIAAVRDTPGITPTQAWAALTHLATDPQTTAPGRLIHQLDTTLTTLRTSSRAEQRHDQQVQADMAAAKAAARPPTPEFLAAKDELARRRRPATPDATPASTTSDETQHATP